MNEPTPLLQSKELTVTDQDGKQRTFLISKFDAVTGREIVAKYPTSAIMQAIPKLGDYQVSEDTMIKLMHYVAVQPAEGPTLRLSSRALINNHVGDWETLAKIEMAMLEYNCSFFTSGRIFGFFDDIAQKFLQKIIEISTLSSEPSSPAGKPPSTSSGPSTH